MNKIDAINIIKLIWPIIAIQLALQIYALIDLLRHKKTKNLSPIIWGLIIVFGEIVGAAAYLIIGRSDADQG